MSRADDTFEIARDMSTYNNCPIYVFFKEGSFKIVAKLDWFNEVHERLTKEGYFVVSVFENGKKTA